MIGGAVRIKRTSLVDLAENEAPAEYWLVFTEAGSSHWWNRWLAPGFRHVFALRWTPRGWIHFDPAMDFARLDFVDAPVYARPQELAPPGSRLLRVETRIQLERMRAPWVVGPVTCVELIKALLGIRSFWLWTPRQLYRRLGGRHG